MSDAQATGPGPDWERPPPSPAVLRRDLLVAAGLVLLSLVMWEIGRSSYLLDDATTPEWEQAAWSVAAAAPLAFRRRWPVVVMLVSAGVFLAMGLRDPLLGVQFTVQVFFFVALYTAAAWGRDRQLVRVAMAVVVLGMFVWVAILMASASLVDEIPELAGEQRGLLTPFVAFVVYQVGINAAYFGGAWVVGQLAWRSARQREQLRRQAIELESRQAAEARRAVLAERLRIARELHDVAAHHVSVIGVQAAAARRVLGVDGQAAGRALGAVEQSSRAAVGEMRQLLGVLRSDQGLDGDEGAGDEGAGDRSPQPSVEHLDALVTQCAEGGLDVRVERVGDARPLPSTVSLSLFRTVQEALANVRRHSTARSARVTVRHSDAPAASAWVEVEVLDEGRPRAGDTTGSGLGHVGMRERAELHGGQVEIGPRPDGGFRVRARYPVPDGEVGVAGVDGLTGAESGVVAR